MILGVGIDVVEIARLASGLAGRNVLPSGCSPRENATFRCGRWPRVSRRRRPWRRRPAWCAGADGRPELKVYSTVAAAAVRAGVTRWHVSLSHDGGVATAVVIAEGGAD
jgi:holo-[acyl-carrier protein] synthase